MFSSRLSWFFTPCINCGRIDFHQTYTDRYLLRYNWRISAIKRQIWVEKASAKKLVTEMLINESGNTKRIVPSTHRWWAQNAMCALNRNLLRNKLLIKVILQQPKKVEPNHKKKAIDFSITMATMNNFCLYVILFAFHSFSFENDRLHIDD